VLLLEAMKHVLEGTAAVSLSVKITSLVNCEQGVRLSVLGKGNSGLHGILILDYYSTLFMCVFKYG
jgi:hypothetical protein